MSWLSPRACQTHLVRDRSPVMEAEMLAGVAARRSAIYWTLADVFLTCPNEAIVARLSNDLVRLSGPETADALTMSLLAETLPDAGDAAGVIGLAVEYTRLFGGLSASYGLPPPYEAVHRKVESAADVAVAVTQCYSDAGLAAVDASVPPDHLGVELKFVSLLCHSESEAWRKNLGAESVQALGRQRAFLDDHLLRWAPDYLKLVQTQARDAFFRKFSQIALTAVTEDRELIEDVLVQLNSTGPTGIAAPIV